jgi:hypothetical protein
VWFSMFNVLPSVKRLARQIAVAELCLGSMLVVVVAGMKEL